MNKQAKGMVIAIDGPDGVGKTTQVKLLAEYLQKIGQKKVHATRSSGGTPVGEALRKVSKSNLPRPAETDLYISLAMGEALGQDISERKQKGELVVIDRSPLSVVAYNGYGSRLSDMQKAFEACGHLYKLWQIDLLIFLSAERAVLDKRLEAHGTIDYFESQGQAYQKRVDKGYQDGLQFLQKRQKQLKTQFVTVDAAPDIDTVRQSIAKNTDQILKAHALSIK